MYSIWLWVILASVVTGLISLIGGALLLLRQRLSGQELKYLVSFAAGAMLAVAFIDIIPEALELGEPRSITWYILIGVIIFFLAEKFLLWHHHGHGHTDIELKPTAPLILVGDTIHNFLDGTIIALTFSASIPLGLATTVAIICHEIPQELGDFAVLLDAGFSSKRALLWNLISSGATLFGALLTLSLGGLMVAERPEPLALAAGSFIYIAAADLIPQIHHEPNRRAMVWQTLCLLLGVAIITLVVRLFE